MDKALSVTSYTVLTILISVIIVRYNSNIYSYVSEKLPDQPKKIETHQDIKLLFVGDMMFDRNVAKHAKKNGLDSIFKEVENIFKDKIVIGNLEGTITNNPSIAQVDNTILRFTFDKTYAGLLKKYNFKALSLANNHSLDFYISGYEETIKNLSENDLLYFGSAKNDANISLKITEAGKNICLIGYHDLYTWDETPIIQEIVRIKDDCYKMIVFTHWGDEYKVKENKRQKDLAHKFIESGADIIIGAHPHVVESLEIYMGKPIFYSLGNFVFDQNFSFNTTHSIVVDIIFKEIETIYKITPIKVVNGQVEIANKEDSKKIINYLVDSDIPEEIKDNIIENNEFSLN